MSNFKSKYMITQEEIEEMNKDYAQICTEEAEKDRLLKLEWRKKLKGLINVSGLFKWLDEHDYWTPLEIVEIYNTDEKTSGYSSYQHVRIKDDKDKLLYMMQDEDEIRNVNHYCVWQTCGMMGDDYSGYLLFPLKNGKYFKVNYSC
jgi:hypothetical protein